VQYPQFRIAYIPLIGIVLSKLIESDVPTIGGVGLLAGAVMIGLFELLTVRRGFKIGLYPFFQDRFKFECGQRPLAYDF